MFIVIFQPHPLQPSFESTLIFPPTQLLPSNSYSKHIQLKIEIYSIIYSLIGVIFIIIFIIYYILRYNLIISLYFSIYSTQNQDSLQDSPQNQHQNPSQTYSPTQNPPSHSNNLNEFSLFKNIKQFFISLLPSNSWKCCHRTLAEIEYESMLIELRKDEFQYNNMNNMRYSNNDNHYSPEYGVPSPNTFGYDYNYGDFNNNTYGNYMMNENVVGYNNHNNNITNNNIINNSNNNNNLGNNQYQNNNMNNNNNNNKNYPENDQDDDEEEGDESFQESGISGQHPIQLTSQVVIGTQMNSI